MLTIKGELPKGYVARRMWLYVAKSRSKWGYWLSDGQGYSVRALIANGNPGGTVAMTSHFSTKHAATKWAEGQGWTVWPGIGRHGVPDLERQGHEKWRTAQTTSVTVAPREGAPCSTES